MHIGQQELGLYPLWIGLLLLFVIALVNLGYDDVLRISESDPDNH